MSYQSQTRNMKQLGKLLSQDLGHIYGERENGPNGEKRQFLHTGRSFLSALGRDLGFSQQRVYANSAGIAVSGEVYLRGIWHCSGIKLELTQDLKYNRCINYRQIADMKDSAGGYPHFITLDEIIKADYVALLERLFIDGKDGVYGRKAA